MVDHWHLSNDELPERIELHCPVFADRPLSRGFLGLVEWSLVLVRIPWNVPDVERVRFGRGVDDFKQRVWGCVVARVSSHVEAGGERGDMHVEI